MNASFRRFCFFSLLLLFLSSPVLLCAQQKRVDVLVKRLADFYFNGYNDSAIYYCNYINSISPNEYAYFMRGRIYGDNNDNDAAIEQFNKAIGLRANFDSAYTARSSINLRKGNYDQVINDCNKAISLNANYAKPYINRGNAYGYKSNYDQAISDYNRALEINPNASDVYVWRGNCYYEKRNYNQAIIDYNKYVELQPKDVAGYFNLGLSYNNKGNSDQAIANFNKVLELDPKYVAAYRNRGVSYNDKGNYDQAILDYTKAIALDPGFSDSYNKRAEVYDTKGDYDMAVIDFTKAIELDPKYAGTYNSRGNTYYHKQNYDLALADFLKSAELSPEYTIAYYNLGVTYHAKFDDEKAITSYTKAIQLDPSYAKAYKGRGSSYSNKGNYDLALKDFNKAIELDPKYADAYIERGWASYEKQNYDLALADDTKAIELEPTVSIPYNNRGLVYYNKGNYELAVQDFKKCLEMEPLNKYSLLNILPNLIRLERFDEAASYYDTYKKNNVNGYIGNNDWEYYRSYLTAALEYVRKNLYKEALDELKISETKYKTFTAIKKDANASAKNGYTDVLSLKGYILEKLQQRDDADAFYGQSLVINPNQPEVKEALVRLKNSKTVVQNNDKTAPEIELISPAPSSTLKTVADNNIIQIIGRAKDASGISKVIINGVMAKNVEEDGLFIDNLQVKKGTNNVSIAAYDKAGNSRTRDFSFNFIGVDNADNTADLPLLNGDHTEPNYYAILIAEQNYADPGIPILKKPVTDALLFKRLLETRYTFSSSKIDTLFNRSREDILGSIIQKCNTLSENDNLLIFYSGHGTAEKDRYGNVDGYLVPCSARKGNSSTYISYDDIFKAVRISNSKHILLIVDACFSGSATKSISTDAPKDVQIAYKNLSRKVMSSGNLEPVPDNSVFLTYLMKKLEENSQKYLITDDLFNSFKKSVITNSGNDPKYEPISRSGDEGGDFIFIRK